MLFFSREAVIMKNDAHAYIVCTCLFRVWLLVVRVVFLLWIEDQSLSIRETGEGIWRNPLHLQQIVFQAEQSQGGARITRVAHSPLPQHPANTTCKRFRHTTMCILHHEIWFKMAKFERWQWDGTYPASSPPKANHVLYHDQTGKHISELLGCTDASAELRFRFMTVSNDSVHLQTNFF